MRKAVFEVVTVPKRRNDWCQKLAQQEFAKKMEAGEMEEVTELLGYIYETEGTVVHGDARGRLLGFPTANVKVKSTVRLPRIGVYAVQIEVGGKWYVGMGSIGHNDTFGKGRDLTSGSLYFWTSIKTSMVSKWWFVGIIIYVTK